VPGCTKNQAPIIEVLFNRLASFFNFHIDFSNWVRFFKKHGKSSVFFVIVGHFSGKVWESRALLGVFSR